MPTTLQDVDRDAMQRWSQHPLVARTMDELGDEAELVDVLESVHEVVTTLEDRFPGLPMADILRTPASSEARARIRATLADHGATHQAVVQLVGEAGGRIGQEPESGFGDSDFELAHRDIPHDQLVEQHGMKPFRARRIRSMTTPLRPTEEDFLNTWEQQRDVPLTHLCRQTGVSERTARGAVLKWRYRRWLERQP